MIYPPIDKDAKIERLEADLYAAKDKLGKAQDFLDDMDLLTCVQFGEDNCQCESCSWNEKLKSARKSIFTLSKCEKTTSAIAEGNSPTPGAALEPIKKEEKDL